MTSFSDKNQVFLYSADKTGDSGFEDLLISPSPKGKPQRSKQTIPNKQEEVVVIDDEDWKNKCKQYEQFLAEIDSDVPNTTPEASQPSQEPPAMAPNPQPAEHRQPPAQQKVEPLQKTVKFIIDQQPPQSEPTAPPPRRQKERITLGPNEWIKQMTLQAETSDTNVDNPNLNLGKESTKQDCHREGREGRGENFRFTVAYSDLMALMQSNNEAFIQLSNERRESEKRRRSSVGRQSVGYEEESQAKQYFQELLFRAEERKARLEKLRLLQAQLQQEAAESERRVAELTARVCEEEKCIVEKQKELSKLRCISLELEDYAEITKPLLYFQAANNIEIFELARDNDEFNCSFVIDEDIFGRIKREKGKTELRLSPSPLLEFQQRPDWLIDTHGRLELLRLYFNLHLQRQELASEVLKSIAHYYQSLEAFEDSLRQIMFLFTVEDLQLSVNSEKLTFRVLLKPEVTVQITVFLLRTDEPDFSEFYHYEGRQSLGLPSPADGKYLRYFQALLRLFAD